MQQAQFSLFLFNIPVSNIVREDNNGVFFSDKGHFEIGRKLEPDILNIRGIVKNNRKQYNAIQKALVSSFHLIQGPPGINILISFNYNVIQWNLSNPTHQGTREMCQFVQDVGILRFYFNKQKYFGTIDLCQMSQHV